MRRAVGVVLLCLASGCAAKVPPFDPEALKSSRPQTLVVAYDRSPPITAEGPAREGLQGSAAYGGVLVGVAPALIFGGMAAAAAVGRDQVANQKRARWMRGCDLDDPVDDVRDDVADALSTAFSLEVEEPTHRTKAKDPEDVIQDHPGADLILDIRTSRWGIHRIKAPSPHGKVHFAVGYDGSLRLIDARKRAVIAESTCSVQFSNGDAPPTITELLEDDCALLVKGLRLTAQTCATRHREALGLE